MSFLRSAVVACSLVGSFAAFGQSVVTRSGATIGLPPNPTDKAIIEFRDPLRATAKSGNALAIAAEERRRVLETDLDRVTGNATEQHVRRVYLRAFNGAAVTIPRSSWEDVAKLPYVKRVHPDSTAHAFASDNINQIGAPQVWASKGTRGRGVVVAILDTGVDYRHPALGGGIGPGFKVIRGWDFVNNDGDPGDDNGHGTHVAGIVAADSPVLTGVAPDVSLIAYKVLDAKGSGDFSQIVAAIDSTLDPNGDGDTSDAADVINLSLGGPGTPDDPVAQAVENANAHGVVVVAAAGNEADFFHIGSPACAPHVITVGASELGGAIAFFSSKGPDTQLYTIKPEVVAPGVNILSTFPGGNTQTLSGTSMAAPHVTGAAALLLAAHPGWTPADVKSALVSTAFGLNDDVMAQGAGRIDVSKAVDATLFLDPAMVDFALADVAHDVWVPSQHLRITNRGSAPVTLTTPVAAAGGPQVPQSWTMTPAGAVLAPGESKDVTVSATIDHRASPYPTGGSLSYGGYLDIAGTRTKWAFVKASRIRIRADEGTPLGFVSDDHQRYRVMGVGGGVAESILPAGTYDVVTWIQVGSEGRIAVREQLEVKGTAELLVATSTLTHTITPAAVDEKGVLLSARPRVPNIGVYQNRLRLVYPEANLNSYFDSAFLDVTRFRTNDIPPVWKIQIGEFYASAADHAIYAVQHRVLDGVNSDLVLEAPALREQEVRLVVPANAGEVHRVFLGSTKHDRYPERTVIESTAHLMLDDTASPWIGRMFLTPDVSATYSYSPSIGLSGRPSSLDEFEPTPLRLFPDGRTAFVPGIAPGPGTQWHAPGSVMMLGGGPIHPRMDFTQISPAALHMNFFFYGANGERRWRDIYSTRWASFNGAGEPIGSGAIDSSNLIITLPAPGPLRFEITDDHATVGGKYSVATYHAWADTTRADFSPPTVSALSLQSASGEQLDVAAPGSDVWLLFGITDTEITARGREYKPIAKDATRVEYRVSGSGAWIAADPQLVVEDIVAAYPGDHTSDGAVYRCRIPAGGIGTTVDVRISGEDSAGNKCDLTLEPAFAVTSKDRKHGVRR